MTCTLRWLSWGIAWGVVLAVRGGAAEPAGGFVDAAQFGFAPDASGTANQQALQRAVDGGGTIFVTRPGVYPLAGTVYLGSHTALRFGAGVALKKVNERGEFCHVLLNKGARTKTYDTGIIVSGLQVIVNGMDVQQSDTVVSSGRLYRVQAKPDGTLYRSVTRPTHPQGSQVLDGINWGVVQEDVTYTAGVRNVVFRDIFLRKPRIGFSVHFDNGRYSRSYYPGAPVPAQEQILLDGIRVLHDQRVQLLAIGTPMDVITIAHTSFRDSRINFHGNRAMPDYGRTQLNLVGCVFGHKGPFELVTNSVPGKRIELTTAASVVRHEAFVARVAPGPGAIKAVSDLPGLAR